MVALVFEPGKQPYEKELNGIDEIQACVGGYVEALRPWRELRLNLLCDEDGRLKGRELNALVCGEPIVGTFAIVGITEDADGVLEWCEADDILKGFVLTTRDIIRLRGEYHREADR